MNTVCIFLDTDGPVIRYFILPGDYSHLDYTYINGIGPDGDDQEQLADLLFDKNGHSKVKFLHEFPTEEVKNGASVIQIGFIG